MELSLAITTTLYIYLPMNRERVAVIISNRKQRRHPATQQSDPNTYEASSTIFGIVIQVTPIIIQAPRPELGIIKALLLREWVFEDCVHLA